jgi:hypothetical protein
MTFSGSVSKKSSKYDPYVIISLSILQNYIISCAVTQLNQLFKLENRDLTFIYLLSIQSIQLNARMQQFGLTGIEFKALKKRIDNPSVRVLIRQGLFLSKGVDCEMNLMVEVF